MILSASRRTDIPAYFMPWFANRLSQGSVLVRNPMNPRQISRICLSREVIDCIVFWSKNPASILSYENSLSPYMYYVQYTLNSYGKDIEPGLPDLAERIHTFQALSDRLGKERVIWRYDPVLLTETHNISWHMKQFQELVGQLADYTHTCVFSFLDTYASIQKELHSHHATAPSRMEQLELAHSFSSAAASAGIQLNTCAEEQDFSGLGITHASCIDKNLIENLLSCRLKVKKDNNGRSLCNCISSIDIGTYHTCRHGCIYCYANHGRALVENTLKLYDADSPLLCGNLHELDTVKEKEMYSLQNHQIIMKF